MVLVGACSAPSIDASLDTDDVKLPDRSPVTGVAGDGGPPPTTDSGRGPDELALTVTLSGQGTGTISSTPSGLTCAGTTCKGSFARGTTVTLVAKPASGALFGGWSGGCIGTSACAAKLDAAVNAMADFESLDGSWSGTYTNTRLANGCTFNNAGNLGVTVKATASTFSSAASVTGLELRNGACQLVGMTTGGSPDATVAIAGDTLTGTWNVAAAGGSLAFPFTAKVVGKTMTGMWTCSTCTGSFKLTKP